MKHGLGLTDDELHDVYARWNREELNSYLVEITAHIFKQMDEKTGRRLIDVIRDEAKQKGSGMWASQDAMDLEVPMPTIDVAVAMRNLSTFETERAAARKLFPPPVSVPLGDRAVLIGRLRNALYAGMIITYAQGMALLVVASAKRGYRLNLEAVARIWRAGCIIRAGLLDDIRAAFRGRPDLPNLLLDPGLAQKVSAQLESLRQIVCIASNLGIPAPGLMASLAYLDSFRSASLPANLIQAQRDYFGAHTYERMDAK